MFGNADEEEVGAFVADVAAAVELVVRVVAVPGITEYTTKVVSQ
jgi:hypothetical protein